MRNPVSLVDCTSGTKPSSKMNAQQADRLSRGLTATARSVRVNTETKEIEIYEGSARGKSWIVRTYKLASQDELDYQGKNMQSALAVHAFTDGGSGRVVDGGILKIWKALELVDNSVKVCADGYSLE